MLEPLIADLYGARPQSILYHYTSLAGLMGIVKSRSLWATEIRYLNDADELIYLGKCIGSAVATREDVGEEVAEILRQFLDWTGQRLSRGHLQFVCSFTESGNLLSQWRGYTPPSKGVSLGFAHEAIVAAAEAQGYWIGKCIYDPTRQNEVVEQLVATVVTAARQAGAAPQSRKAISQSYHEVFEGLEADILRVAAVLKNPAFHEENEWRLVSPLQINYVESPILYREGTESLVPYLDFALPKAGDGRVELFHIFVGPTPSSNLSTHSLSMFLSKYAVCPAIINSRLPFKGALTS